jgi:uncharacterized protein YlxW (UPF0749 family)
MTTEDQLVTVPEELSEAQALIVLINAARIGQKAGIYSLEEAELISKAIRRFSAPVVPSSNS